MHYLVKFRNGPDGVADWCTRMGRTAKTYAQLPGVALLDLTEEESEQLSGAPDVEYLEADGLLICNADAANTPPGMLPNHLQQICAVSNATGAGVRVAVLDTGVDSRAPGLPVAAGVSFVETEPAADDTFWHGTWVAALVAADAEELGVVGVAPQAEIYAAKMMDRTGVGRFSQALAALEWAIEQQVDIVLMAFGSAKASAALTELLSRADELGILLVAAAGNDGQVGVNFPARLPFVLGVGASDESGVAAKFSNEGEGLDVLAPGVAVPSLYLFGNVFIQSGTSASAALAAGVAALLKSSNKALSGPELRDLLVAGSGTPDAFATAGVGVLNAHASLHLAEKYKRANTWPAVVDWTTTCVRETSVGQKESACLQASDPQHVYGLRTPQSMALEIALQAPEGCEYEFYVYAKERRLVGLGRRDSGEDKRFRLHADAGVSYSIQVFGYGGDCHDREPYTLCTRALVAEASVALFPEQMDEVCDLLVGGTQETALYAELDVHWYKVTLAQGQALEIDMSHVPMHCQYTMELYDADGTCVAQARPLAGRLQVLTFDTDQGGVYGLKVFSRQGFDANHPYALHADLYRALSGIVSGTVTLMAADGPYLLGADGLSVATGAVLTVEAGTVLSLRSSARLRVQDGGSLIFAGTIARPIHLLGARASEEAGVDSIQEVEWDRKRSQVRWEYVNVQYDSVQPDTVQTAGEIAPSERPRASRQWYLQASPYQLSLFEPLAMQKIELYFGMDVATFIQWEVDSDRISDERLATGAINYWEFVNGHFTRDQQEAQRLFNLRQTSPNMRVQRMIDFLQQGVSWVEQHGCLTVTKLWRLLNGSAAKALYHHLKTLSIAFWWSHNSSIVEWDKRARELGLEAQEAFYERAFLNGVILRLDLTTDLPFNLPVYGNNIPPIGWLGLFLTRGAFRYPAEYPAPKPPEIPSGLLDYHGQTTLEVLKAYCRFVHQKGSNAVYTWWLPTPADLELQQREQGTTLPLAAPDEDWKLEYLEPQLKTLEEITRKYVRNMTESGQQEAGIAAGQARGKA